MRYKDKIARAMAINAESIASANTAQLADVVHQPALNTTNANVTANTNATAINNALITTNTNAITGLGSGSPSGVYATVALLTSAYPTGNTKIYLVTADGTWRYWTAGAWTSGGTYQSTGIAPNSVAKTMLDINTNAIIDQTGILYPLTTKTEIVNTDAIVSGNNQITIQSGHTGNGSTIKQYGIYPNLANIVGNTVRIYLVYQFGTSEFNVTKISPTMSVMRNGVKVYPTVTNMVRTPLVGANLYYVTVDYVVIAGDTELQPWFTVLNTTALTANCTFTLLNVYAQSLVGSFMPYANDTMILNQMNSDLKNSSELNKIYVDILNSCTYTGSIQTGCTMSGDNKTITIPIGYSGYASSIQCVYNIPSYSKINDIVTFLVNISVDDANVYLLNLSLGFNVFRNGATVTGAGVIKGYPTQLSSGLYQIACNYTIQALDTQLIPFVNFGGNTNLTTQSVVSIVDVKVYSNNNNAITDLNTNLNNSMSAITQNSDVSTQIYNNNPDQTSVIFNTINMNLIVLNFIAGQNSTIRAYGLLSSGSYTLLSLTNLKTGNSMQLVSNYGKYYIDTSLFNTIKFINTESDLGNSTLQAFVITTNHINEVPLQIVGHNYNAKIPVPVPTVISGANVLAVNNGIIYRITGNMISCSNNWGVDSYSTVLGTCAGIDTIYKMIFMANGNVTIWGLNGKVYTTTDHFVTFNLLIDMGASPTNTSFGAQTYGNYLMFCQYSNVYDMATNVYISEDSGLTCRVIFNIDAQPFFAAHGVKQHTHSCAIDPYELDINGKPMLWVVTGDGTLQQQYFWSKDFGTTWYTVTYFNAPAVQATEVIPLKNCVLFLSDARQVSVMRYNRPVTGTQIGQYQSIEVALLLHENWGNVALTEVPIGSTPFIDFVNNKVYFGWNLSSTAFSGNTTNDACLRGQVWTTDGYIFTQIYADANLINGGVQGVYGDSLGNVVARLDNGTNPYIKFNTNMWS